MAKIYAELILAGRKQFDEVPDKIVEEVKDVFKDYVANSKISPEQFEELVGEVYVG